MTTKPAPTPVTGKQLVAIPAVVVVALTALVALARVFGVDVCGCAEPVVLSITPSSAPAPDAGR